MKEIIVWFITSVIRGYVFSRDGSSVCLSVSRIIRPDVAGGKVSPGNGNLGHYYLHKVGLFRGQNQPVRVTVAALLKYGQRCTWPMRDFFPIWKKTSILNIFAHWVMKLYQYNYLIPTESYWNRLSRGCSIFSVRFLKNAQALSWYFNPYFTYFYYFK